jgi:polyisoprenoid-binding protein YceI
MNRVIRLACTAALTAAFAAPALATQETYAIDGTHTFPRFEYNHFGFSTQLSRFNKTSGTVTLDRTAKSGSVDVVIDATSVDTGHALFDGHIQGEDFFHTEKYPTITFKSTGVNFAGDKLASVDGNLTIKGITKPVTLEVTSFHCMPHPIVKNDACGANATTTIKRSDFGAGKHAPYVSDEVKLTIAIEAVKQ